MHISKLDELHRRAFLKRSAQLGTMGVAAPFALNMSLVNQAAAFTGGGGYQAMVCLFLLGGNDHDDTLIPYDDTNYNLYSAIRGGGAGQTAGGIARAKADLAATVLNPLAPQTLTNNMQYALHPAMTRMKTRWDQGRLATLLNISLSVWPRDCKMSEGYQRLKSRWWAKKQRLFSSSEGYRQILFHPRLWLTQW